MVVAVPFSCVCPKRVSVRGVVLCPQIEPRLLLDRFAAHRQEALNGGPIGERRSGRHWVKKHFDLVNPPSSRVELPPFGFTRYLAFARVRNALVTDNRLNVGFDIFVGPGEYPAPVRKGDQALTSPRAINGFADIAHYPLFDNEVAKRERSAVTGHAAVCLVEQPNDLFGDGWRLRGDRVLQVISEDKVGAMLLVEATTHWRHRRMRFDPNPAVRHQVANPLERGFLFRARLVVKLPKIRDQRVVGL